MILGILKIYLNLYYQDNMLHVHLVYHFMYLKMNGCLKKLWDMFRWCFINSII